MNIVKAKIYWILEQDGGRKNIPSNHNYSTLVHFDDIQEEYPLGAWSVVIDLEKAQKNSQWTISDFRFLVDSAPQDLLYSGSKFKLYEGARLVANGEIL